MVKFAQLPKYEAYKDSGVEWLGEIPVEWDVIRFRDLFKFGRGLTITKADLEDEGVPCINYGEVHSKFGFEFTPRKHHLKCVSEDYLLTNPNSLLEKGDFIFADTSEDIEGSGNFSQLVTDDAVFAGYHSVICRPIGRNNYRYLAYCLESTSYRNQVRQQVKGVKVYSITQAILKNTEVWLPNLEEQTLIANFLDQKASQIDAAIAIKEQQIELLKERKQIIIQQAVTQGLAPNVPMKDSGVEWIGQIPEHWKVLANRALFSERVEPGRDGLPLLSVSIHTGVSSEEISEEENIRGRVRIEDKTKYIYVAIGDIAFNMMRAWQGGIGAVKTNGMVSPAYIVAKPTGLISSDFFEYQYRCPHFIQQMDRFSKGITDFRKRLYWDNFKELLTIVPPLPEQLNINKYIVSESKTTEAAILLQSSQIQKLKEYKTTLINSAVTGKIKITPEMLQA